jgi:hypothetical protein
VLDEAAVDGRAQRKGATVVHCLDVAPTSTNSGVRKPFATTLF